MTQEIRATFRFQAFEISQDELNVLRKHSLIDQSVYSRRTMFITPKKALETLASLDEKADQRDTLQRQVQQMKEELDTIQSRSTNLSKELAQVEADRKKAREQLEKVLSENDKLKRENAELKNTVRRLEEEKQRGTA